MENSAESLPALLSQVTPKITSAPYTRRTKIGTWKWELDNCKRKLGQNPWHWMYLPLPTITENGWTDLVSKLRREVTLGWTILCALPQSTRILISLLAMYPVTRSVCEDDNPKNVACERDKNAGGCSSELVTVGSSSMLYWSSFSTIRRNWGWAFIVRCILFRAFEPKSNFSSFL